MKTKEKIIYEALTLFSYKGYDAVSIREIGRAVGIKESSLYNHFKNKKHILETIVDKTLKRYIKTLDNLKMPEAKASNVSTFFDNLSENAFLDICSNIFLFYLEDDYISKLRRLLTIEQYNNKEIGKIFTTFFIDRVLENHSNILQSFIDSGRFIKGDAYTMALQFYGPVFLLLYKYDKDKEGNKKAIVHLKKHAIQYNNIYLNKNIKE